MIECLMKLFGYVKEVKPTKQVNMGIKTGYDWKGQPYLDLTDEHTVKMLLKQAPKFDKIMLHNK